MGCGGSWGAKGGFFHTLEQKSSHCVLMEVQKGAQYTCQAEKVIGSSFTPSVALLISAPQWHHTPHNKLSITKQQT